MSSNSGDGVFCPHCGETVAARTFRLHRSLFYSESSRAWMVSESDRDEDMENTSVMKVDRCTEEQNTIGGNYRGN